MKLLEIPDECILRALSCLEEYQDILSFQSCSKRCRDLGADSSLWRRHLQSTYGISFEKQTSAEAPPHQLQELFKVTTTASNEKYLLLKGVFTDGGVDQHQMGFWVNNLFEANLNRHFCSTLGENVNCIGLLAVSKKANEEAEREEKERKLMVDRLTLYSCVINNVGPIIDLNNVDLHNFDEETIGREKRRLEEMDSVSLREFLRQLYDQLHQDQIDKVHRIVRRYRFPPVAEDLHSGIIAGQKDRNILLDKTTLANLCKTRGEYCQGNFAGIIEECWIDRSGSFSCPVSCGALFACLHKKPSFNSSTLVEECANSFAGLLKSKICSGFNNLEDLPCLAAANEKGLLPPIVVSSHSPCGIWCEFDRAWQCPEVQPINPIAWFKFWTREQAKFYSEIAYTAWDQEDLASVLDNSKHIQRLVKLVRAVEESHEAALEQQLGIGGIQMAINNLLPRAPFNRHAAFQFDRNAAEEPNRTAAAERNINRFQFPLRQRRVCNAVVVKLISPENRMEEWDDSHEGPNIDASVAAFKGRTILLPDHLHLQL